MTRKYPSVLGSTLQDAQEWVEDHREEGVECPCCGQFAKVYRRSVNGAMAHALILIAFGTKVGEADADGWLHVPTFLCQKTTRVTVRGGDFAKLRYWGLLEEKPGMVRDDGSKRAGFWRITEKGLHFVLKKVKIPKYALIYNNSMIGFAGPDVGVVECLGKKFDYSALMAGRGGA
tara:strand:- start:191 stop:715 length:525 start_codon:yes stop_codon:yes gene_type:complete